MAQTGPSFQIKLANARPLQGVHLRVVHQVAKAGFKPSESAIDGRKLHIQVGIQHFLLRGSRDQVHAPAPQAGVHYQFGHVACGARGVNLTGCMGAGHVAAAHHHQPVAFLPCIDAVVHVAGRKLKPADRVWCTPARNHAKTRGYLGVKADFVPTQRQGVFVMEKRQIMQHGVVRGNGHVMGQTRTGQGDWHMVHQRAVRPQNAIVHVGRLGAVVEKHQFASALVHFGMGRYAPAAGLNCLGLAQSFQRNRVQLISVARHVPQRKRLARVAHDVGVGGVFEAFVGAAFQGFPNAEMGCGLGLVLLCPAVGAHPAVAVGQAAPLKVRGMHHAIPVKWVVTPAGLKAGVGACPQVHAVQIAGNLPAQQGQIGALMFLKHWRVHAAEVGAVVLTKRCAKCGRSGVMHGRNSPLRATAPACSELGFQLMPVPQGWQ